MALHIVGHTFGEVFEARKIALVKAGMKRVMVAHGVSNNDVFEAFAQFDEDRNGTIDYNEVKSPRVRKEWTRSGGAWPPSCVPRGHSSTLTAAFELPSRGFRIDSHPPAWQFRNALLERLSLPLDNEQLRKVWRVIDEDRSGSVDYAEFAVALFPDLEVPEQCKLSQVAPDPELSSS